MTTLAYSGGWLDRASGRRADPAWLADLLVQPETSILPIWNDRCLLESGKPVLRRGAAAAGVRDALADRPAVFLGLEKNGGAVFAADLSGLAEDRALTVACGERTGDIRALAGAVGPAEAALLAYARGLIYWNRNQAFCGGCGTRTEAEAGGHQRRCQNQDCGRLHFPRIEPAVITVVETGAEPRRCLLARHQGAPPDGFSTLAGFVEVGESLEDAVRREVAEEAGVTVGETRYVASQAWPFPSGLMAGFRSVAVSEDIQVDGEELVEARWFTRDEVIALAEARGRLGRPDSIGHLLLQDWLG